MTVDEQIAQFKTEGIEEPTSGRYEDALIEVGEVLVDKTGAGAAHEFLKSWEEGQVIIIVNFKILSGDWKGGNFNFVQNLYTKQGKLNMYRTFTGEDGSIIPSSYLGELVHRIKEFDAEQWDDSAFTDAKLVGKKFEIGVRGYEGEEKQSFFAAWEKQLKKDEDYQKENPVGTETADDGIEFEDEVLVTPEKEEKKLPPKKEAEDDIVAEDLPF